MLELYEQDAFEFMETMNGDCVNLILTDPPYGITGAPWDEKPDTARLFKEFRRILKPFGNLLIFGVPPFSSAIVHENRKAYSHTLYWKKNASTGFLNSKNQPLRIVEEIAVFRFAHADNTGKFLEARKYMQTERRRAKLTRSQCNEICGSQMSSHYFTNGAQFALPSREAYEKLQSATGFFQKDYRELSEMMTNGGGGNKRRVCFNPCAETEIIKSSNTSTTLYAGMKRKPGEVFEALKGCPTNLLEYKISKKTGHPSEKPVDLLERLINLYSNPGDLVFDPFMGTGATGAACLQAGRRFIGIERDNGFFEKAKERLEGMEC